MDSEDGQALMLTFSEPNPVTNEEISLTPDGQGMNKEVTESNKLEYIQLLTQYLLITRCQTSMNEIVAGFRDVFGDAFTGHISVEQLRTALCGERIIDVESLIQFSFFILSSLPISFFLSFFHISISSLTSFC